MRTFILLCLVPSCYCPLGIFGSMQSVGVMGTLTCQGGRPRRTILRLYELEICGIKTTKMFHRKLAETKPDFFGKFKISGSAREVSKIDPRLSIYHRCRYIGVKLAHWQKIDELLIMIIVLDYHSCSQKLLFKPCYKRIRIEIPSEYIASGKVVKKYFDIGKLELTRKPKEQRIDCI
ncbi:unnamed protein product [Strongylus vulgaris]|uniref:Transthyretin-like family protein n=1 Tax=Strongylus vulgaris TaxID=40348 RepID=A0A3P7KCB5_STRVU|nr:unnamed protein product [Strongylus vulgaris]